MLLAESLNPFLVAFVSQKLTSTEKRDKPGLLNKFPWTISTGQEVSILYPAFQLDRGAVEQVKLAILDKKFNLSTLL